MLFENSVPDFFYSHKKEKTERFSSLVNLSSPGQERYFRIYIDPTISEYFIRGIRKKVGIHSGKTELNFYIKYTHDGFMAKVD